MVLIFDEVITGLGRCGGLTGAGVFGVQPDIMTLAKQLTNGVIPMGAVAVRQSSEQYLSLTDQAFSRLLGYSLLAIAGFTVAVQVWPSRGSGGAPKSKKAVVPVRMLS